MEAPRLEFKLKWEGLLKKKNQQQMEHLLFLMFRGKRCVEGISGGTFDIADDFWFGSFVGKDRCI